jgi:hypothetical protein
VSFIIVLFSTSFSQTNLAYLQKQLPQSIQQNPELLKQVTKTLERDIILNPSLVAYRVNYYNNLFDNGIKDNGLNGLDNLKLLTVYYYKERNKWIENEKNVIAKSSFNESYKNNSIGLLEDYLTEIVDSLELAQMNLEKNFIDYFAAIAMGTENLGDFSPTVDYSINRIGSQEIIINSYIEKTNWIKNEKLLDEPVEKILDYWYLFPNETQNNKFYVSDYLLEYYKSLYSTKSFDLNSAYLGASFFYLKEELDVSSSNSQISSDLVFGRIKNATQINFSFNRKFLFSENLSPFSFFTTGLMAGFSMDAKDEDIDPKIDYTREPLSNGGFISQTRNISNISISEIFKTSFYLKGSVPVLFFNKHAFIELGFITGVNINTYKLDYEYQYDKVQVVWNESLQRYVSTLLERDFSGPQTERNTSSEFIFYPNVDLTIQNFNPIALQVSMGYNYVSAKVGYAF